MCALEQGLCCLGVFCTQRSRTPQIQGAFYPLPGEGGESKSCTQGKPHAMTPLGRVSPAPTPGCSPRSCSHPWVLSQTLLTPASTETPGCSQINAELSRQKLPVNAGQNKPYKKPLQHLATPEPEAALATSSALGGGLWGAPGRM